MNVTTQAAVLLLPRAEPETDPDAAKEATENASFAASDLIPAGIIFGSAIVIALLARYVVEKLLNHWNTIIARLIARTIAAVVVVVGLIYALSDLGIDVGLLFGALGVGGFALAFAMRDTLENLISGIILQVRQPFDYDDTVQLGEYAGTVTDINLRSVEMTVFSGEKVIIPSSEVLHNPIENWTANPNKRIDIDVGVSYDVDIDDVCRLLTEALEDVEGRIESPPPDTVFDGFGDSAINLKARVWYPSDGPFFDVQRDAAARVKRALDGAGIDMPFPTTVVLSGGDHSGDGDGDGGREADDELPAPDPDERVAATSAGGESEAGDADDGEEEERSDDGAEGEG